jgi:hypothetical protein
MAIRRTKLYRTETIIMLTSLLIIILLTAVGNSGALSTMGFQGMALPSIL